MRSGAFTCRLYRPEPAPVLGDVDGRADRDLRVEVLDVGDAHAHAAVRRGVADRPVLRRVDAVDARAVEDAQPTGLERVARGATGDDLAALALGDPRGVRLGPGGIDRLVLDVVEPGRGLQADHPDGNRIRLGEPELLVQLELEVAAVDDQRRRVLLR